MWRRADPPVWLPANAVAMLGLDFHELAINAAKHAALSVPESHVEICWSLQRGQSGARVAKIAGRERGRPPGEATAS